MRKILFKSELIIFHVPVNAISFWHKFSVEYCSKNKVIVLGKYLNSESQRTLNLLGIQLKTKCIYKQSKLWYQAKVKRFADVFIIFNEFFFFFIICKNCFCLFEFRFLVINTYRQTILPR